VIHPNRRCWVHWWRTAIDEAADIWDDDSRANFDFQHYTASEQDWYKHTDYYDDRPGVTQSTIINAELCQITGIWTFYNTRYTFADCDDDCDHDDGEFDAKHVAVHEFAHWFVLDDTDLPWQHWCVSYPKYGTDHSLCSHDKDRVQDIYGED